MYNRELYDIDLLQWYLINYVANFKCNLAIHLYSVEYMIVKQVY